MTLLEESGVFDPGGASRVGDGLIKDRVDTFEKAFPREAKAIRDELIPRLKNEPSGYFLSPYPS